MNTDKLYHIQNFDSFNNVFTIYQKHIVTYKRITDENEEYDIESNNKKYKILSDYIKYIPIYGHYYNNNNLFICKKIVNHKFLDYPYPDNFLIIKNNELSRPHNGGIYIAKDIDDLYNLISILKGST